LPRAKIWVVPTPSPGELLCNATRLIGTDGRMFDTSDPQDSSAAERLGRRQECDYARFFRDFIPVCESSFVNDAVVQAGIRQSRSIVGVKRLTNGDVTERRECPDCSAQSPWPIEFHVGDTPKLDWLHDDFYEAPYGALVPEVGEN